MFQPKRNPKDLLVIQTARSKEAINHAAKEGFRPLVKAVIPSKKIHSMMMVYQDETTGEIEVSGDVRWGPRDKKRVIEPTFYYPYHFESPYAAYLIPPELEVGTRVWLDDVIEDIVAVHGNQGHSPRLKWSEATWNGRAFDIHFDPDKDAPRLIG